MGEKDILQSAKNIQNYCLNRKCDDCPFLFATGKGLETDGCALNYPAQWQDLKDWDKYLDDESEAENE